MILKEENSREISTQFRKDQANWFNVWAFSTNYSGPATSEIKTYKDSWKEEVVEGAVWDMVAHCSNNSLAFYLNGQKAQEQYEIYREARSPQMKSIHLDSTSGEIFVARFKMSKDEHSPCFSCKRFQLTTQVHSHRTKKWPAERVEDG